mgnify:CR=1 FL=1
MMVRKTVLPNGLRIVSEPLRYLKSVSLGIWIDIGSRDESAAECGTCHFIEHMLFKGTRRRSALDIALELDAIGGLSNAFTAKENTCFYARVLDKHFGRLADILADIVFNSTLSPEEVERERQVILQEICMVEDTPDEHIHDLFTELSWKDHPMGMPIQGTVESVGGIEQTALAEFIRRRYVPEKTIVAAAGNIEHEEVVAFFRPLFEGLPSGEDAPARLMPELNAGLLVREKDLEQVHICLGASAPSQRDPQRFASAVFNTILGGNMSSRLFQEIREKRGLAYAVYSFLSSYADAALLGVYMATDAQQVNPALEIIEREIGKIRRGEVSEEELTHAKDNLVGGLYLGAEGAEGRMMRLAKNEFLFGRYVSYDELAESIERVRLDEVVEVSRSIFEDGRLALATLGPMKEEEVAADILHF